MSVLLAQRQLALAGVALLAGLFALGIGSRAREQPAPDLPRSIPTPDGGWSSALASSHGRSFERKHRDEACGRVVGPTSRGVAHPVLPCDTKLYISFGDRQTLTQVLARGVESAGREFEISPLLARELGLSGTQPVEWRYAR